MTLILIFCRLGLTTVDLDKEFSPHGLALTFDDVQLIIGILYCVGTVEISSQRIESLLLIAQANISKYYILLCILFCVY